MRYALAACIALCIVLTCSGCAQQHAPPVSVPTPSLTIITPEVASLAQTPVQRQIDLVAGQSGSDIVVKYRGGADAPDLVALVITIQSSTLQTKTEEEDKPNVGQQYIFPQMGTPEQDSVNVVGIFKDGSQQTLLQTAV